jgi:DAACS family dicarboxylate/amino acid:cation (Na+ or H+) symporter
MAQHHKLLLGLVLGILTGLLLNPFQDIEGVQFFLTQVCLPMGQIFLRLIFMVVIPLIFCALVNGVAELFEQKGVGSVLRMTLFYTLIMSAASVFVGIGIVHFVRPGSHVTISIPESSAAGVKSIEASAAQAKSGTQALVELIPKNPLESAVKAFDGEIIAFMIFALIFGLALGQLKQSGRAMSLPSILDDIYHISMKIIGYAMAIAPLGVFGLVTHSTAKFGVALLGSLSIYVLCVLAGLAIQQFVVYSLLLKFVAKISPIQFLKDIREVLLYAFSTASGNATLPESLKTAQKHLQISPSVAKFVLTVGATANQNGTALFEGITVLFLAQVYGIDLSFAQQGQVVLMSILAGIGTAGVPGGSLPLIAVLLQSLGIPAEGLGIILGVDRFLDMCRTTLNVSGDLVIAKLVDCSQKKCERLNSRKELDLHERTESKCESLIILKN